jgi:Ca2+-binding RTX toxin-like protein
MDDIIYLQGTPQNDVINGTEHANTLYGGRGDDTISGGQGNDTYLYNLGDGYDTFHDTMHTDTILFGEGIEPSDIKVHTNSNQMTITIKEEGTITITNWGSYHEYIENLKFNDGRTLSANDLLFKAGTPLHDTIYATDRADILYGNKGDDTLYGRNGDDTYIFNLGDGQTTIHDTHGNDKIIFGEQITKQHLIITTSPSDLIITFTNSTDQITIKNWVEYHKNIETIRLNNGRVLDRSAILKLASTPQSDTIYGSEHAETLYGNGGDDTLIGSHGDDTLIIQNWNDTNQAVEKFWFYSGRFVDKEDILNNIGDE